MSDSTKKFLAFVVFIVTWSFLASVAMGVGINVLVVFIAWLVGFVWGIGLIVDGPASAGLLLKRWLQMMAGILIVGGAIAMFLG